MRRPRFRPLLGPWVRALVAGPLLLVAAACSSSSTTATSTTPPSTEGTTTTTAATPGGGTGSTLATLPTGTATIDQTTNDLGTILVDGRGFTLYLLTTDQGGASPCVDACAKAWPPLTGTQIGVADGIPVTPGKFTLVTRPDGTTQVAVSGHPLYRYSGDTLAGQTNGQGVGGTWFVVGLDGNAIRS